MINKKQVGSRLASLRKAAGYSQTSIAEILNVSPQAVSKWENGVALPDVEILLEISRTFMISINEILEGNNPIPKLTSKNHTLTDGIVYFLPEVERDYAPEYCVQDYADEMSKWAQRIIEESWVKRNWDHIISDKSRTSVVADAAIQHGGLILELGVGPGGGYVPRILLRNPDAHIILSDYSPTVVREWKKLMDNEVFPPNINYVVLDNCIIPFDDCTFDVVTCAGFGNTVGDKSKAIMEIFRVLKPGGLYAYGDGFVTQETLKALPLEAQRVLLEKRPDIFEDYFGVLTIAGVPEN